MINPDIELLKRMVEVLALKPKKGNGRAPARKHGISKKFRQYAKRYGNKTVEDIVQTHKQYDVKPLNHWRDRMGEEAWHSYSRAVAERCGYPL